ncbi:MAG TPA: AAA family ATPase [Pirellulales bacterium]|nr:AAA family ATPase [Pirellulales bacterium]
MEHIHYKGTARARSSNHRAGGTQSSPIEISLRGRVLSRGIQPFSATTLLNARDNYNEIFFEREEAKQGNKTLIERNADGSGALEGSPARFNPGRSGLREWHGLRAFIEAWQFLRLAPPEMGEPWPRTRTGGQIRLAKDGSNIAEYLLDIRERDLAAFTGIIETLRVVLPYAADVQPALTSELERKVYLQLSEVGFKVPGWLLSSGTLRILALLALLRHPNPPPLLVIEEIENGLDPRTIHLLVDEIHSAVESGRTQVILTTHSPYLLDLLPLSSIMLVERVGGEPKFTRPAEIAEVRQWAKRFAPGQLYTAARLRLPDHQEPKSA